MRINREQFFLITACVSWMMIIGIGLSLLWGYQNAAGPNAAPPSEWPLASSIRPASDRATLIMLAHPHCPCTRASIGELARLMTQAQGRVTAYVLFFKPEGTSEDWEKTDLWQNASRIPGVDAIADDGVEARRFQAVTSGQTVLYSPEGRLLFSGGITASRGHSGDNAGRGAIVSLLNTGEAELAETEVFGCPLLGADSECQGSLDDRHKH